MRSAVHVALLLFLCRPASAETFYNFALGAPLLQDTPATSSSWLPAYHFSLGFGRGGQDSPLSFTGLTQISRSRLNTVSYLSPSYASLPLDTGVMIEGGSVTVLQALAGLKVDLVSGRASMVPYVLTGLGVSSIFADDPVGYLVDGDPASFSLLRDRFAVGASFGFGVDLRVSPRISVFTEGTYDVGFTDVDAVRLVPIRIGVRLLGAPERVRIFL